MMESAKRLDVYQITTFKDFAVEEFKKNHISTILGNNDSQISLTMTKILEKNYGESLDAFLRKFPVMKVDSMNEYRWTLYGSGRRNYSLKFARDENGTRIDSTTTGVIGVNCARFELVFEETAALFGEEIIGERREYPMRVVEKPRQEGSDVVLVVELSNGSYSGIPAKLLVPGKRFYHGPYYVPRGHSIEGSGVRFSRPSIMRNEFSQIRKTIKVSGDVWGEKIKTTIPVIDTNGNTVLTGAWATFEQYEFERQFMDEVSLAMWSTKSNRTENGEYTNTDSSGEVIRKGDGLVEQLQASNLFYYSKFTLDRFNEVLYQFKKGDEVVAFTGKEGANQASQAIGNQASGFSNITINADALNIVGKTTSDYHPNSLKYGYMFTEWISPTGVTIKINVLDYYDDPVRCILQIDGRPADSRRYDIIELSGSLGSAEKNICKVEPSTGGSFSGYAWGMRNPFTGQSYNSNMSFPQDMATYDRMVYVGVLVKDPTRCVVMLPSAYATID